MYHRAGCIYCPLPSQYVIDDHPPPGIFHETATHETWSAVHGVSSLELGTGSIQTPACAHNSAH